MAKCKDCLHYCACVMMYEKTWGEPPKIGGGDGQCDTFTERSRYVVREKGEWIKQLKEGYWITDDGPVWKSIELPLCPKCHKEYGKLAFDYNFCPNCGADMRKRTDEQSRALADHISVPCRVAAYNPL